MHHELLESFKFRMSRIWSKAQDDCLAGGEEGPGLSESVQGELPVRHGPGAHTVHGDVDVNAQLQQI